MSKDKIASIERVRKVGIVEGVSYLLLLGVAMPLKYLAGIAIAVKVIGWAHGALFVLLAAVALHALLSKALKFGEAFMVGIASLVPFGPFLIDGKLKKAQSLVETSVN